MKNKKLEAFYLYSDGHAKAVFSTRHPVYGELRHVEVWEKLCEVLSVPESGRIVFHDGGLFPVIKSANYVQAWPDNGSENTRAKGYTVQSVAIHNDFGSFAVSEIPGVLSGGLTFQFSGYGERFDAGLARWSEYPVAKIHRVKAKA